MLATILLLAAKTGIYAEPAGVAALAGLRKMVRERRINRKDRVVVLISGSGLKDPLSSRFLQKSDFPRIGSSLSQLERALWPAKRV